MPPTSTTSLQLTLTLTPQPPTHLNLLDIISHLLPPRYPLPPHLLSTSIKTRHLYLPPPVEDKMDDAYVTQPERLGFEDGNDHDQAQRSSSTSSSSALMHGMKNKTITDRLFSISSKLEDYRRSIDPDRVQGESGSSSSGYHPHRYAHERSQKTSSQPRPQEDKEMVTDPVMDDYIAGLRKTITYSRRDRETLLARLQLTDDLSSLSGRHATLGGGQARGDEDEDEDEDAVDLVLLHEPGMGMAMGDETDRSDWKLFNLVLPPRRTDSSSFSGHGGGSGFSSSSSPTTTTSNELHNVWSPVIPTDDPVGLNRTSGGRVEGGGAGAAEVGEMGGQVEDDPDDFWGGYDDDDHHHDHQEPRQDVGAGISPPPALASTMAMDLTDDTPPPTRPDPHQPKIQDPVVEDDPYWASYGSVEDGLRASNPPTPGGERGGFGFGSGGVGRHLTPSWGKSQGGLAGEKDYWGTGGETPVGWSPAVKEIQLYPEEQEDEDEQKEEEEKPVDQVVIDPKESISNGVAPRSDSPTTPTLPSSETSAIKRPSPPPSQQQQQQQPRPPTIGQPDDLLSTERRRRRQETLRSTLVALRDMYTGDEREWREVLNELL